MNIVKNFISKEMSYFKKLHAEAQRLISSIILFNLISPIFGIFVNAFLWRQSQDMILVAVFNLVFFMLIPFAFYANGLLLKKFAPNILCYTSLAIEGLVIASLIFFDTITYTTVVIIAVLYGITAGIYWANRNLLKLKTTQSHDRIYFTSIEASSGTVTGVFIPLFIGWFIALGSIIHLYSHVQGYQMISLMMLIIIAAIGFVMHGHAIKHTAGKLLVRNISKSWRRFRVLEFFYGLNNGMLIFIPTLMVLILVGNEEALGTIQSLSAIIASLIVYILAKYLDVKHRVLLFAVSTILLLIGGSVFGMLYSAFAVAIFFACSALSQPLSWIAISSLNLDMIDKNQHEHHYAYVCDQEIYLNGGRVVGIILFIAAVYFLSNEQALRYTPFFMAASQLLVLLLAKSVEKHHANN